MKKFILSLTIFLAFLSFSPNLASAQSYDYTKDLQTSSQNLLKYSVGEAKQDDGSGADKPGFVNLAIFAPLSANITGIKRQNQELKAGLLPEGSKVFVAMFNDNSFPSSREYMADLLDNMGIPTISSAYAQGTGYTAMKPFLPFWKAFRNLAYSLYIVIFIVIGVMIMLRTKVNAQTIISIQSALPNLLVTLILITFSYAIVGLMVDLMYFLIYFIVYLVEGIGIIQTPTTTISRLLNYSAWSVIFEGRNSIVSAAAVAIDNILYGLGTNGLEFLGSVAAFVSPSYLIAAVALAIAMLKLMFNLIKAYIMLIIQTITAPVQILMNAMPGSKAFSGWLKKTASYLIPFPVAAAMFIFSAILIGDPTKATILDSWDSRDANPFSINTNHPLYADAEEQLWLPPFTLTGSVDFNSHDVFVLIGLFVFTMTPAATKMAMEWLQVKESPYVAEAISNIGMGVKGGTLPITQLWGMTQEDLKQRRSASHLSAAIKRSENPTVRNPAN